MKKNLLGRGRQFSRRLAGLRNLVPLLALGILFGGGAFPAALAEFSAVVWGSTTAGKTNVPLLATNLTALAAGQDHLLALRADGHIFAWGANSFGQTNVPVAASNIIQVAAGGTHNLVLRNDGVLLAWGNNIFGSTTIPSAATNVSLAAIAAGVNHNLVLRTNGAVYVWGNPNIGITNPPARATNGLRIAAGRFLAGHNLLLRRDGTAVGWGSNTYGQTNPPPTATNLVAIAAGGQFSLGLKADGTVLGWGENFAGQTTIPPEATNVVAVAAGLNYSLALRANGSIVGWGSNSSGKRNIPVAVSNAVAVAIAAGSEYSASLLGDGAPRFVDALVDLVAYSNHVFHLNALAVGAPPLNYQWRFNDEEIPGANSGVFTLASVQFTNAGAYSVVVSNHLGVRTGLVANLTVEVQPTLPVVVAAPESQTVNAGSEVTFSVVAGGHPAPTYQWQYANTNLLGATNANYTIPYARTNQAGNYRVVLSNSVGAVTSSVAALTVTLPEWPVINTWPASRGVSYGSPVTLTVVPTPSAGPVTYTWQLNGTNLPNVSGPNLTFNGFTVADGGVYRVAVSNQFGGSLSPEFEIAAVPVAAWGAGVLTNLPRALTNAIALSVGVQHAVALKADGQIVAWGDDVVIAGFFPPYTTNDFGLTRVPAVATNIAGLAVGRYHTLAVRGDGTVVAWGRNIGGETIVPATATNVIAVAAGDAHSLALRADGTLVAWGTNHTGQINIPLAATNIVAIAAGDSHNVALRSDGQILVWGNPNTLVTTVPAAATNTVAISARANYTIAIQADGTKITWGSNVPMQTPFSTGSPAPWPIYSWDHLGAAGGFSHAVYLHFGGVECLYYFGGGFSGNDARLRPPTWLQNVVAVAAGNVSFALMQPPDGLPVRQVEQRQTFVGAPAVFSAHVEGQRAMSVVNSGRYQWRFNGEDLTGETNRALVLSAATPGQSGDYSVVLSNWSGAVTSQNASLVVAAPPPPEILQPPVSQTVGAGGPVTFSVALAYGIPGQLQWWLEDQEIPGATGANLLLTNVQPPHAGDYWVVVTNFSGSITSLPATLVVTAAPPVLVTQPTSVAKALGLPVSITAQATGTEPIFYQWYRAGEVIPAATNAILALAAIQPADFGAYVVVATNLSGAITSNPALLIETGIAAWGANTSLNETIPLTASNVMALAAGDGHALVLRADGSVLGWGNNSCGQATIPAAATNVVRIAANALRSLVLRDDGQVLVWGHTSGGVSTLPPGLSNVVEIAAGVMHNLALRGDGSVAAWGHNWSGHDITPPESATNVVAIAAGMFHSLALRADGIIVGWGNNRAGQIAIPASATNLVSIAAGFNFSAGLRADGTVLAWGELPINPSLRATYSCGGHSMSVGVGSVTNDLIALPAAATNIVALAAGREHLLMLRADGTLIFAGNNESGQDDVGLISNVIGIAAGGNQNLALTGVPAPRLGGHQTNRIAAVGASVVLNPAVGGMSPRRGWLWRSPGGSFEPGLPYRFLSAATAEDQGEFQFVVTNAFGALTGAISLTLTASPPRLLTEPASQFAVAGSDVSFSVMAAGTMPLSYQWQRNGTNLADGLELTGATTPTLILLNVQSDAAANYRVVVTNSQGSVTSSNAALVVFAADPLAVALDSEDLVWTTGGPGGWRWQTAITQDGVDAAETGPYLEDQTNWVETTVTGPTTVSFWWRAFGWITDRFSFSVNGVERMAVANDFNWQQRSYYLPAGTHTLRWTYVCEPVGGNSAAWLDQVVLTNAMLPLLTTQPTSRSVQVGANTTFNSATSGTEPFNYQWRFNDADVSGATNASLTLSQVQPAQAGNYTLVVSNVVGVVTSQVAVLTVNDSMPTIQFTSSLLTAAPGTAPSFGSTILGSTPMNIVWQRNQQNLPDTASSSLVLSNLQPAQAGKYRVVAANAFGTAFSPEAELVIVPVATWGSSLFQGRVPAHVGDVVGLAGGFNHSVALRRDGTVVYWGNYQAITSFTALANDNQLIAVAAANNHDLGLRADGTVIVFGDTSSYGLGDIPAEATDIVAIATSGQHNLALRADGNVVSWGDNHAGLLTVPPDATNLVGISAAVGYSLALQDTGALRAWGRNDFGQLNVPAGNDYLAVAAGYRHAVALREDGTVVAWGDNEHGQTNVPPGLSNVVAIATRNYHTLALRQDGKVFAWGQNTLGQTDIWPTLTNVVGIAAGSSHSLALVGDGRPVINLPPLRRRIESGADAVLRVLATGAGPLHYQWQHNGTNIPGATNATLLVSGGGNYSVTVSNQLGKVDSPSVPVIVTPPALRFDSAPGAIQLLTDGLHLRLLGASGRGPIVVLASADFIAWTPIRTNPPVVGEWTFVDAAATNLTRRFYRAVEIESPVLLPLQFVAPVYANTATGGWFRATLTGLSGSGPVTILGSSNLVDWQSVLTNGPVVGGWDFEHVQPNPPTLFWYRASEQR